MAKSILEAAVAKGWTNTSDPDIISAVAIRVGKRDSRNVFVIAPEDDPRVGPFKAALHSLNPECCFTLTSPTVKTITDNLPLDVNVLILSSSLRIQVLDSWDELAHARPAQMACFVRQESTLVLWYHTAFDFKAKTQEWEDRLAQYIWEQAQGRPAELSQPVPLDSETVTESSDLSRETVNVDDKSLSSELERCESPRPTLYYNTIYVGSAVGLGEFPS